MNIDKELLKALDNLSDSLEQISLALANKKEGASSTTTALKKGDFGKTLEEISVSIKSVKSDTQEILKNQQTILSQAKKKKTSAVEDVGGDKKQESNIKKGAATILLIAVAVLAIGLAFKLVGKIDFLSVVGLALAITIVSIAFEKVAKLKLTIKQSIITSLTMVMMSVAIMLSSYALSYVQPVGITQLTSSILIAGIFVALSYGIKNVIRSFDGMSIGELILASLFIPLILPAMALAIAGASYALALVQPIGFTQFISSLFISILFIALAFSIKNILQGLDGVGMGALLAATLMMPILFSAMSIAIMLSSEYLSQVKMITFGQFLVSLGISLLFVVLSFGIKKIVKGVSEMDWGSVPKIPVFFTLISLAITLSSIILAEAKSIEWEDLLKIASLGVILSAIVLIMTLPIKILSKVGMGDLVKGGIAILIIATTIMISSHILAIGNYETFPGLDWIIGVGLSLMTFGLTAFGLGLLVFGPQALIFLAGLVAIIAVAGTILAVSKILSEGQYDNKGMLGWAVATSLLYMTFTPIIFALGAMSLGSAALSFFGIDDPFESSKGMLISIAETIVSVASVLKSGDYTGGPTEEWAKGISIALGAFMPVYDMMMKNSIMSIFGGGGVGPDDFTKAILTITDGIIVSAERFASSKAAFKGGPKEEWSEGVGLAIGAFAPVYSILMDGSIMDAIGIGGVSPESFKQAIVTISAGIVEAALAFAGVSDIFKTKYPSVDWGEGVGSALGAFAPVFDSLSGRGWTESGPEVLNNMVLGIKMMTLSIITSAIYFNKSKPEWWSIDKIPSVDWGSNVGNAIQSFTDLFASIKEQASFLGSGTGVAIDMSNTISIIVRSMIRTAAKFSVNSKWFQVEINPNFFKKLAKNIIDYTRLAEYLTIMDKKNKGGLFTQDPVRKIASGMVVLAKSYDALASSFDKFGVSLDKINIEKLREVKSLQVKQLSNNLEQIKSPEENTWIDKMSGAASSAVDLVTPKFMKSKENDKLSEDGKTIPQQLDELIEILSRIDESTNTIDEYIKSLDDTITNIPDADNMM